MTLKKEKKGDRVTNIEEKIYNLGGDKIPYRG
jgi:hypothetical protein